MTTTPDPGKTSAEPWKARACRSTIWSAAGGLALIAASAALVLSWRDELPNPIASHWGIAGEPDGFMPLDQWVATMAVAGVLCIALFAAIGWFWGRAAQTRKVAAGCAVGMGAFLAIIQAVSIGGQRDLTDAATARQSSGWIALALLGAIVLGGVAAILVPRDPRQAAPGQVRAGAERVALADGERAVWLRTVGSGVGLGVGATTVLLMTGLSVLTRQWGLLAVPAALAVLFASMMIFEVRVDASGVRVRSALGWPRMTIPADEVVGARAVDVHAFRTFGGWGWRVGPGGHVGIVPRSGLGIEVERTGGRFVTVTVDDAETGAALLNTMADRARKHGADA